MSIGIHVLPFYGKPSPPPGDQRIPRNDLLDSDLAEIGFQLIEHRHRYLDIYLKDRRVTSIPMRGISRRLIKQVCGAFITQMASPFKRKRRRKGRNID